MSDIVDITIQYNRQEHTFPVTVQQVGYTYRIVVHVGETALYFEPDEERNLRLVLLPEQDEKQIDKLDKGLLQALHAEIESLLR